MLRNLLKDWRHIEEPLLVTRQVGALPYAMVEGRMAFLLVTTRRSGRWIFPKGAIEPDMTPWQSAALEAFEEAGVVGEIAETPYGQYRAAGGASGGKLLDIDLYPMLVTQQLDVWKEKEQRLRHWVTVREARRLLANKPLADIVQAFHDTHVVSSRA